MHYWQLQVQVQATSTYINNPLSHPKDTPKTHSFEKLVNWVLSRYSYPGQPQQHKWCNRWWFFSLKQYICSSTQYRETQLECSVGWTESKDITWMWSLESPSDWQVKCSSGIGCVWMFTEHLTPEPLVKPGTRSAVSKTPEPSLCNREAILRGLKILHRDGPSV